MAEAAVTGDTVDSALIPPHGGVLVDRLLSREEASARLRALSSAPHLRLDARQVSDVHCLAIGAFSPLRGFMGEADHDGVCQRMRLASGELWPLPVVLAAGSEVARGLTTGTEVVLDDVAGRPLAVLTVSEVYRVDRKREAEAVFGTADEAHPGVKNVIAMPPWCVAGRVILFEDIPGRTFLQYSREPRQTRAKFRKDPTHYARLQHALKLEDIQKLASTSGN